MWVNVRIQLKCIRLGSHVEVWDLSVGFVTSNTFQVPTTNASFCGVVLPKFFINTITIYESEQHIPS